MDIIDNKIKYSCSEEEWQKHLKEEEENAKPYFEMLEKEDQEYSMKIKLEMAMNKFEDCLKEWIDLEEYIYSLEYRQAFIDFILPRLKRIDTYAELENLVTMTLHHKTGDRRPYFEFDRGDK